MVPNRHRLQRIQAGLRIIGIGREAILKLGTISARKRKQRPGDGHRGHGRRVAARCTVSGMTQADSGSPRALGQPVESDAVTALEITARETVDEAASYIAQAIETDDPAEAKVLYGLAAGVLKTAATAITELRKEARRQS
jgi:hypothetical protein